MERSSPAGGAYLMHHCARCGAEQGDNVLYGNYGATDRPRPLPEEEVWHVLACTEGHWGWLGPARAWPEGSRPRRPDRAVGLVGEHSVARRAGGSDGR